MALSINYIGRYQCVFGIGFYYAHLFDGWHICIRVLVFELEIET